MGRSDERALKVAEILLDIEAVRLSPSNPFTWASGLRSPIYCDNRKTLSYPANRSTLRDAFADLIKNHYPQAEVIAAVATGGIALGALVADALELPLVYVRSEAKKHGLNNQVEGALKPGQKAVVIEDLVSTGGSSLKAVDALRDAGAEVLGMLAIFTYGFEIARASFSSRQVNLHCLTNFDALIDQAIIRGAINPQDSETLLQWKQNPEQWSANFIATLQPSSQK